MRQRWDNLPQMNQLKYGTFYAIILDMGILQMLRVVALLGFSIYISWRLVKKSGYAGWGGHSFLRTHIKYFSHPVFRLY